jgi:hypothetical protein
VRTILITAAALGACTHAPSAPIAETEEPDPYRNDTHGGRCHDAAVDAEPDAPRKPFIEIVTIDAGVDAAQPAVAEKPKGSVRDSVDVTVPGSQGDRPQPAPDEEPQPERVELAWEMRETKPIAGVHVIASPIAAWRLWVVQVENRTGDTITVDWDRSAFVMPDGESSRVIRGETRRIDIGRPQPKATIIAGAHIEEELIPEVFVDALEALASEPMTAEPPDGLRGARLVLAIERGSGTKMWTGTLAKKRGKARR